MVVEWWRFRSSSLKIAELSIDELKMQNAKSWCVEFSKEMSRFCVL